MTTLVAGQHLLQMGVFGRWAVAVGGGTVSMVIMKSVAAKPSRARTKIFLSRTTAVARAWADGSLAVRAFAGDPAIDRQRTQHRQCDE
jgi:hypothetical protein